MGSDRPEADGFRISFTPLDGVLFTVPSRYWCTIGRLQYLALGRGRPCFPPDVSCPAVLTFVRHRPPLHVAYGALTRSGRPFQDRSAVKSCPGEGSVAPSPHYVQPPSGSADWLVTPNRFRLLPFRSPLLRESSLFLEVLRCFSSPGALRAQHGDDPSRSPGCPIRRPRDHRVPAPPPSISPRGRVLPRLQAPRHPPSAHKCSSCTACKRASVPHAGRSASHPGVVHVCACSRQCVRFCDMRPSCRRGSQGNDFLRAALLGRRSCPVVGTNDLDDPVVNVRTTQHDDVSVCGNWCAGSCRLCPGGAAGIRTPDLRRAKAALSQLSYGPANMRVPTGFPRVGAPGFEPGTSALSGPRSNHLSYAPGQPQRGVHPR